MGRYADMLEERANRPRGEELSILVPADLKVRGGVAELLYMMKWSEEQSIPIFRVKKDG